MGFFTNVTGRISKSGRNLKKREFQLERDRAKAALADIRAEQAFRLEEDPREQAAMTQSMFARGMGKSSIREQDTARITGMQARRNAALFRAEGIAAQGLSLIRRRRKYGQRTAWAQSLDDILALAGATGFGGSQATGGGKSGTGVFGGQTGQYDFGFSP